MLGSYVYFCAHKNYTERHGAQKKGAQEKKGPREKGHRKKGAHSFWERGKKGHTFFLFNQNLNINQIYLRII